MAEVIWTEPALADLDALGDHIALDAYEASRRLIGKVFERVDLLEAHPRVGRVSRDLRNTLYRKLVVNPADIYYRIDGEKVIIIHISRAERNFDPTRLSRRR
jgi:plasmid stabilization system protein ParE